MNHMHISNFYSSPLNVSEAKNNFYTSVLSWDDHSADKEK
jgi:hypothetical protein